MRFFVVVQIVIYLRTILYVDAESFSCDIESLYLNTCSQETLNCTGSFSTGCADGGEETYCCETQNQICCDYGNPASNGQCVDNMYSTIQSEQRHCHTFCSYFIKNGVQLVSGSVGSNGGTCKVTADGRVPMITPDWTEYGVAAFAPDSTQIIERLNRGTLPPTDCAFSCLPGYSGTEKRLRCELDFNCTQTLANANACAPGPSDGGPYIVDDDTNQSIASVGDIVCTENMCAPIVVPEGALVSSINSATTCANGTRLSAPDTNAMCVLSCNVSAGYVAASALISCDSTSNSGDQLQSTYHENGTLLTCLLKTCEAISASTMVTNGIEYVNASASSCQSSGISVGSSCDVQCEKGFASINASGGVSTSGVITFAIGCDASYDTFPDLNTLCAPCRSGSFSSTSGSSACTSCPSNTYTESDSATSCVSCPSGKSSGVGSSECFDCYGAYLLSWGHCEIPVMAILLAFVSIVVCSVFYLTYRRLNEQNKNTAREAKRQKQILNRLKGDQEMRFDTVWLSVLRSKSDDEYIGLEPQSTQIASAETFGSFAFQGRLTTEFNGHDFVREVFVNEVYGNDVDRDLLLDLQRLTCHERIASIFDCLPPSDEREKHGLNKLRRFSSHSTTMSTRKYLSVRAYYGSSLEELSRTRKIEERSMVQRSVWMRDMCEGIRWLHDNGHVHGNLQLSNVLISERTKTNEATSRAVISDMHASRNITTIDIESIVSIRSLCALISATGKASMPSSMHWIAPECSDFVQSVYLTSGKTKKSLKSRKSRRGGTTSGRRTRSNGHLSFVDSDTELLSRQGNSREDIDPTGSVLWRCPECWSLLSTSDALEDLDSVGRNLWVHRPCIERFIKLRSNVKLRTIESRANALLQSRSVDIYCVGRVVEFLTDSDNIGDNVAVESERGSKSHRSATGLSGIVRRCLRSNPADRPTIHSVARRLVESNRIGRALSKPFRSNPMDIDVKSSEPFMTFSLEAS